MARTASLFSAYLLALFLMAIAYSVVPPPVESGMAIQGRFLLTAPVE